jgi:hypothetical protein
MHDAECHDNAHTKNTHKEFAEPFSDAASTPSCEIKSDLPENVNRRGAAC